MTPAKCLPTERIGQMRPVYVDDVFTTTRLTSNLQGSFGEIACELCTSSILCSNVNWGLCHMTTQTAFFLTFSKPVQSVSPLRVHDKSKLIPTLIRSTSVCFCEASCSFRKITGTVSVNTPQEFALCFPRPRCDGHCLSLAIGRVPCPVCLTPISIHCWERAELEMQRSGPEPRFTLTPLMIVRMKPLLKANFDLCEP